MIKFLLAFFLFSSPAFAELDSELAEVSSSHYNREGLYVGLQGGFGTALDTGASRGGAATSYAATVGYVMPKGSWDRLEVGGSIGRGSRRFKEEAGTKATQTVEDVQQAIFRLGIGYSLSTAAMVVWRIGAGLVTAEYMAEYNGIKEKSSANFTGPMGQIGADVILQATTEFDFVLGVTLNHYQFEIDKVKNGSVSRQVDRPLNINETKAVLGLRWQL